MEKNNVNKKIKTEVALAIIVLVSLIFGIVVYRAGSFSAALNYIPMASRKKEASVKNSNWVLFATNGDRKIYKVQKDDGKWAVIIDGQEGEAYDEVFGGVFSDDGVHFAYGARNDDWDFVVLDGVASDKKYADIGQLIFNRDGMLIYKVIDESGQYLVIGDEEGERYDIIGDIVILDDGRIAFQAEIGGEQVTVIDGQIVGDDEEDQNSESENENTVEDDDEEESQVYVPKPVKVERQKKDTVITETPQSYLVCDGNDCNF